MHIPLGTWVALMLVIVAVLIVGTLSNIGRWAYEAKPLLTPVEQVVFGQLRRVFPEYVLLAQVSLSQAVAIKASGKRRQAMFNRVSAKSLDFVLCSEDFKIVAAIELDDKSHDRDVQRKRDADKDRVLQSAGVPLLRWRAGRVPATVDMRRAVEDAIGTFQVAERKR